MQSILLRESISPLLSGLCFALRMAALQTQADREDCGNVWTFSLYGPFHLRSLLLLVPVDPFSQNGLSWILGSRSTAAPAGAGNSSACCPPRASSD